VIERKRGSSSGTGNKTPSHGDRFRWRLGNKDMGRPGTVVYGKRKGGRVDLKSPQKERDQKKLRQNLAAVNQK